MKKVKMTENQFRQFVRKTIRSVQKESKNKYSNMTDEALIGRFVKLQMKEMTDSSGLAIKDEGLVPTDVSQVNDDMENKTIDDLEEKIDLDESILIIKTIVKEINNKNLSFNNCLKLAEAIGKPIPKKYHKILQNLYNKSTENVIKEEKIRDEFQRLVF